MEKNNEIRTAALGLKQTAPLLAMESSKKRNQALAAVADSLAAHREEIFAANAGDLARAAREALPDSIAARLRFDEHKLEDVLAGISQLMKLPDLLNRVLLKRELDQGLILERRAVPIGVVGIIFEARPDAMVQISALCIKSGNCAVLKGGREAEETNRVLFALIREAVLRAGLPDCLVQATSHSDIDALLDCDDCVDLLIPRGSNAFVQHIMNHTKIPVMGHADGVCHIFVDEAYDPAKLVPLVIDAKTQYPAACNAAETLLISRKAADPVLAAVIPALRKAQVRLYGDVELAQRLHIPEAEAFHHEYVDLAMTLHLVEDVEEAVRHINRYGSHHTDMIVTENREHAEYFMNAVDSAGVYWNASTRFADGYRYGFGAEVGISTSKLHARGPVGLEGLMTYKYRLSGQGDIVADFAEGRRAFHHRDITEEA